MTEKLLQYKHTKYEGCPKCHSDNVRVRIDREGYSDVVECCTEGCGFEDYAKFENRKYPYKRDES